LVSPSALTTNAPDGYRSQLIVDFPLATLGRCASLRGQTTNNPYFEIYSEIYFEISMDWQLLGLSFVMVFLSELGDKSQLAAITLGSNTRSPRIAFLGVAVGLVFTSFLGVLLGEGVSQFLPIYWLKAIAAIGFALMGLWLILPKSGKI
jgi:putative Ca2+/H+ antiporter (TMEM165/GDT1 family)